MKTDPGSRLAATEAAAAGQAELEIKALRLDGHTMFINIQHSCETPRDRSDPADSRC